MEAIQRDRMEGYVMQAYIATNPHTKEPEKLLKALQKQLDDLAGVSSYYSDPEAAPEVGAFDTLARLLGKPKKK